MDIKKRIYNLDLLRILACFMVIVIHVCSYYWDCTSYNSFEFNVYNFYDSLVRAAVPLFIMISGVFFLSPDKEISIKKLFTKYIPKLIFIYIFWSVAYYFYNVYRDYYALGVKELLLFVLRGSFHFWYLPVIAGLYLISPLLKNMIKNCDEKTFKYFLIIFMGGCLLNTISCCTFIPGINLINIVIDKLPVNIICQFYSYFLLGYFLYYYKLSRTQTNIIYGCGIISVIACSTLTYFLSRSSGYNNVDLYKEFSIFSFFEAAALFLFFKYKTFKSEKIYSDNVWNISNCTLGIYIIHVLVMYLLFDLKLIDIRAFNPILSVPVVSVVTFIISLLIVYILKKNKIFNKLL